MGHGDAGRGAAPALPATSAAAAGLVAWRFGAPASADAGMPATWEHSASCQHPQLLSSQKLSSVPAHEEALGDSMADEDEEFVAAGALLFLSGDTSTSDHSLGHNRSCSLEPQSSRGPSGRPQATQQQQPAPARQAAPAPLHPAIHQAREPQPVHSEGSSSHSGHIAPARSSLPTDQRTHFRPMAAAPPAPRMYLMSYMHPSMAYRMAYAPLPPAPLRHSCPAPPIYFHPALHRPPHPAQRPRPEQCSPPSKRAKVHPECIGSDSKFEDGAGTWTDTDEEDVEVAEPAGSQVAAAAKPQHSSSGMVRQSVRPPADSWPERDQRSCSAMLPMRPRGAMAMYACPPGMRAVPRSCLPFHPMHPGAVAHAWVGPGRMQAPPAAAAAAAMRRAMACTLPPFVPGPWGMPVVPAHLRPVHAVPRE